MNDGVLHQPIDEDSRMVDSQHKNGSKGGDAHGGSGFHSEDFLDPSRWWFASAAFPMVAGTLGPVASAFSICALVRPWRQHIPPGLAVTQAEFVDDPVWLTIINAIQLAIAIVANLFLLMNMAKRVRFAVAQPVTIAGWYISSLALVALLIAAGNTMILEPKVDYLWSQAFYYAIFSAILYFIVATLMAITAGGAYAGRYKKDFELTPSQRTLMLQTIMFLMYLLVGALVFSAIEGWNYLDAVYWADVTLFTVGYGDYSPATTLGRALLIPYAFIGIISLGLVIGSIRSLVLDRGKRRLDARMLEKKRRQALRALRRKGKDGMLEPIENETLAALDDPNGDDTTPRTEFSRRRLEFKLMRNIQDKASRRRRWTALLISMLTWLVLWLVGAKIFQVSEYPYQNWNYFDGFYFAFTGLTTIGYGDLSPVSPSGKAFFVFWSLLALPTMTVLISNAGDTFVKLIRDGTIKLGNVTILPGEHGMKREAKQLLAKISCGVFFRAEDLDEDVEEDPPGFLGAARKRPDDGDDDEKVGKGGDDTADDGTQTKDEENDSGRPGKGNGKDSRSEKASTIEKGLITKGSPSNTPKTPSTPTDSKTDGDDTQKPTQAHRAEQEAEGDLCTDLPATRSEYLLRLIQEITRVTRHLQCSPPRKYTFKEWAYYLRLIGEDESSAETHGRPRKKQHPGPNGHNHGKHAHSHSRRGTHDPSSDVDKIGTIHEHEEAKPKDGGGGAGGGGGSTATETADGKPKWSWVGQRSPLMDSRMEADWILEQLEKRLEEELQADVDEHAPLTRVHSDPVDGADDDTVGGGDDVMMVDDADEATLQSMS